MSLKVNRAHRCYNLVWSVNITDEVRHYESSVFVLAKAKWRLRLLRDMHFFGTEENLKMFLRKLHPEEIRCHSFLISIYVEDESKKLQNLMTLRSVFPYTSEDVILWQPISCIVSRHPDVVLRGLVTFVIMFLPDHNFNSNMEYNTEDKRIQTPSFLNAQPCLESLSMDLEKLLEREDEKDVELHCPDGSVLKAHRGVLTSRSDVFAAMLDHDTIERSKGRIEIDDVDYDTMRLFLRYLYTGALPELDLGLASGLYEVGDKYAVLSLRNRCANFLRENLSEENACDILILSDTRNDKDLKECVLTYMIRNDLVMSVCEESAIRDTHPKLGFDVLFRAYKLTRRSYK